MEYFVESADGTILAVHENQDVAIADARRLRAARVWKIDQDTSELVALVDTHWSYGLRGAA